MSMVQQHARSALRDTIVPSMQPDHLLISLNTTVLPDTTARLVQAVLINLVAPKVSMALYPIAGLHQIAKTAWEEGIVEWRASVILRAQVHVLLVTIVNLEPLFQILLMESQEMSVLEGTTA